MKGKYAIAIHGGAGTITRKSMTSEKETAYREVLAAALASGEAVLQQGDSAVSAVEAAVRYMEDSELFNAGRGAVFTHEGTHEMDASIMDGKGRRAGAVAGVESVKNPIALSRAVMDHSDHVFLIGKGAEDFAALNGIESVHPSYFSTKFRKEQLMKIRDSHVTQLDHSDDSLKKHGTVGAVALDTNGNLAAATSTGGITNKRYARVGDTPVIGSGTYAENGVCAISSTGWGEYFLRAVAAYDVAALMKYGKLSLDEAARKVIFEHIAPMGGDGGFIAIDSEGRISMPFNTEGMFECSIRLPSPEAER
ncbi:MAG: isoaspartyl peptidase/L-asparaginase [Flavobacteriales bacterium]|nr:isoaspartyl peptidase/L-asparaginase [Flavobacteriales bacterium]